jgi:hypothetical protein
MSFHPLTTIFTYALDPLVVGITPLDLVAALRLCVALRQIRDAFGKSQKSFLHSLSATLIVVYGGEAITAPLLGVPPSFLVSGLYPALYALVQAIVDALPAVPTPSIHSELPLALVDGFTRAFLLCSLVPPPVIASPSAALATSPWTLLVTSLVCASPSIHPLTHTPNR